MKSILIMVSLSLLLFYGCGKKEPPPGFDFENALRNANEIIISEKIINLGKDYELYVDGIKVGKIYGKDVKLWADEFKLETEDGKLLASEKEHKRILRFTRTASVHDKKGTLMGFIGEETLTKIFSIGYTFHFYDANKTKIGISDQVNISLLKKNKFYDNSGNMDYLVEKQWNFIRDVYKLSVKDRNSEIPLEMALLMVCIEDAIHDAHEAKAKKE